MRYISQEEEDTYEKMGDYSTIMSVSQTNREFMNLSSVTADAEESKVVWIRGRVHSIRIKGGSCFLVLRQNSSTVQATFFKSARY